MEVNTQDYIVPINKVNKYSFPFIFLILLLFIPTYYFLHGFEGVHNVSNLKAIAIFGIPAFILGNVLHELVHALAWIVFGKLSFKDIKFGIDIKSVSAYAHLTQPVKLSAYRISIILPGLFVGLIPGLWGMFTGNFLALLWGIIFSISAASDFIVYKILAGLPGSTLVSDHEEEIGCKVYTNMPPSDRTSNDIINSYLIILYVVLLYFGLLIGMKFAPNIRHIWSNFIN